MKKLFINTIPKKKKNSFIIVILSIFFILLLTMLFFVSRNTPKPLPPLSELSEMNGSECLELFEKHGLILPDEYNNNRMQAEKDVEYILDEMQDASTPSTIYAISRAGIHELADKIEDILNTNSYNTEN